MFKPFFKKINKILFGGSWFSNVLNGLLLLFVVVTLTSRIPHWIKLYQMEGTSAQSVLVKDLKGNTINLPGDLLKPCVLIFWATWCAPCKVELHRHQKAIDAGELSKDQVIAIDVGESQETIERSIKENNYTFRVLLDDSGQAANLYQVQGTPTIVHLNEKSEMNWIATGISPTAIYRAKQLLKQP